MTGGDSATGQDVGLLTRTDPEADQIRFDRRTGTSGTVTRGVTKNYIARIPVGQLRISFIGLHFLAFPTDTGRRDQRQAQANAIRKMAIDERAAGNSLVILGDYNDFEGDSQALDHQDNRPIINVLETIRLLDRSTPADDLTNVARFVPQAERFTSFFDRNNNNVPNPPEEFSSIDHILLSSDLAGRIESARIPHRFNPVEVSDHFPVIVPIRTTGSPTPPPPPGTSPIKISALLPNPSGTEAQDEAVTVKNTGTQAISLIGWKLRDSAGGIWQLDSLGTLRPNQQKMLRRRGQAMTLDNSGDTVELLNASGVVVQRFTYGNVVRDEVVSPQP